jgi:hypothetical protein
MPSIRRVTQSMNECGAFFAFAGSSSNDSSARVDFRSTYTLVYLSLIAYLITYLRRTHAATWLQIGRPFQIPTNRFNFTEWLALFRAALLTGRFIFLSNQYSRADSGHVEPPSRHGRARPGHPRLVCRVAARRTWMPATSAGMTKTEGDSIRSKHALSSTMPHVTKLIWSIRIVLVGCFFFLAVVLKLSP